jgi:hypothetical protein
MGSEKFITIAACSGTLLEPFAGETVNTDGGVLSYSELVVKLNI